jgi:hypothetical protein
MLTLSAVTLNSAAMAVKENASAPTSAAPRISVLRSNLDMSFLPPVVKLVE